MYSDKERQLMHDAAEIAGDYVNSRERKRRRGRGRTMKTCDCGNKFGGVKYDRCYKCR